MTNNIDKLWGEALDKAVPDTYSSLTWTQVEKIKQVFAELIIRECADVSNQAEKQCQHPGTAMKKHFGVEE